MRRVKMCDAFMNAQCSNNEKIMTCGTPLCHPQLINSGSIRARSDIITSPEQELSVSCNELLAWMSSLSP